MDALAHPIIALYGLSNGILATGIADLSDRDARERSRGGTGPSISWTIGHLCHFKIKALELLGRSPDNPFGSTFEQPATDGANYPPLGSLASRFADLHAELFAALAGSADRLQAPMPGAGLHDEKRVVDTVMFLAWHEAYHIGGIGAIRRELGRKGIAELVQASAA